MTDRSEPSDPALTFIVPVRHQENAKDWPLLKANLTQTIASIASQTSDNWRGVVVANEGADLPHMPPQFEIDWVRFPPNYIHERGAATREEFLDAFRIDKGRRVLAGMMAARNSRYFMVVDDDDFVSNRLATYVAGQNDSFGWVIRQGFVWNDGGRFLFAHDDFNHICGSSLIINAQIYDLPDQAEGAPLEFIMQMLGSHHGVEALLEQRNTPLTPLPFRGAVYRVAHAGSHSQTPGFAKKYIFTRNWYRYPRTLLRKLLQIIRIGEAQRKEFFGQ